MDGGRGGRCLARSPSVASPLKGSLPDERLVKDEPHAVPVRRRQRPRLEVLLRREVRQRAHHRAPGGVERPVAVHRAGQTEVEEHDLVARGHEHVVGLDVAVTLAEAMHRLQRVGQLQRGPADPPDRRLLLRLRAMAVIGEPLREGLAGRARCPS